jgi:hypothetical protein
MLLVLARGWVVAAAKPSDVVPGMKSVLPPGNILGNVSFRPNDSEIAVAQVTTFH